MVTVNPRKISHEELYLREAAIRKQRYEALSQLVFGDSEKEGAKILSFSSKKLYHEFVMACYLASGVHKDQKDKAGQPYIYHPATVAEYIREAVEPSKDRDRMMIVALLHDVLEDSPMDARALEMFGFSRKIIKTVQLMSRGAQEDYDEYLDQVSTSKIAMRVKWGDLKDNMNLYRIPEPTQRDIRRKEFYRKRFLLLEERLNPVLPEEESPDGERSEDQCDAHA